MKNDPNPRAVYTAMKSRDKMKGIKGFAKDSVKARGGSPVVAHGKMDTKKGWMPSNLSAWGSENIGHVDDARDMVRELDSGVKGPRRGEIWRKLHKGVGAWRNDDLSTPLKPTHYKDVD